MIYRVLVPAAAVLAFLYRMYLDALRARSDQNSVPENVSDVYDAETYRKWKSYRREKRRLERAGSIVEFIGDLVLFLTGLCAAFAGLFPGDPFRQMAAVVLLSSLLGLLTLPLSWMDTMGVEEKYGFNRTGKKTFWLDRIKEFAISLVLEIGLGALLMGVHLWLGDWMVPVFALAMMGFALLVSFLYPFFSRIFNRFTPLEDGELKQTLTAMLEKHGYRVRAIQVMDASRRSTRSNAYFTGFGKMKTIVLYDTLVNTMTPEEICAVFAHEMGHGLHRDTLKNQALSFVRILAMGVMAWLVVRTPELFTAYGFEEVNYGFALLVMGTLLSVFSPLFDLLSHWVSRRAEYRADAQAASEGYAEALISGLKKLSRENFADLSPDPTLVLLTYSHPTLSQRIDAIRQKDGGRH